MWIQNELDTIMTWFVAWIREQGTSVIPNAITEMYFESNAVLYLIIFTTTFILFWSVISFLTIRNKNTHLSSSFTPWQH